MKKYIIGFGIVFLIVLVAASALIAFADTSGPNNPSVFNQVGITNDTWSNLSNLGACDTTYATVSLTNAGSPSKTASSTAYAFAIPSTATINGISLSITRHAATLNDVSDTTVQLVKAGVATGSNKASATKWPTSDAVATYGSSADLWGTTWTPTDINNANFGFNFTIDKALAGTVVSSVDCAKMTVTYTIPPNTNRSQFTQSQGTFTLTQGTMIIP